MRKSALMSELQFAIEPHTAATSHAKREKLLADPGFGQVFADHMVTIEYTEGRGWHDASVRPYGPISLSPSAAALHYAQEIFEGLKAYRAPDGGIVMFRPERNAARFNLSAKRMAMPRLPEELFLESLRQLIRIDRDWVPSAPEQSLYLRPFMFATEAFLGVRPAHTFLFVVIASPVGAYFRQGVQPVSVWLSTEYSRAAPGGTGAAKCAGNYAASLIAQAEAIEHGCDQVVWLDAATHEWVEEMGGMNLFFVYGAASGRPRLVTPELTGTLLPGVTRESLLELGKSLGYDVEERRISVAEWRRAAANGELSEVFACGTAAVITPVGSVKSAQGDFTIGDGNPGSVTMALRERLLDIQHGRVADTFGWIHRVN